MPIVNNLYARLTEFKIKSENFYYSVNDLCWNVGIVEQKKEKTKLKRAIADLSKFFNDSTQWVSSVKNSKLFSKFYSTCKKVLGNLLNVFRNSFSQEIYPNVVQRLYNFLNSFALFSNTCKI